jgi:hypothetical protein
MLGKIPKPRRMSTLSILILFPKVRRFREAKKSKALKMLTYSKAEVRVIRALGCWRTVSTIS